jgi:hypothetical protein
LPHGGGGAGDGIATKIDEKHRELEFHGFGVKTLNNHMPRR